MAAASLFVFGALLPDSYTDSHRPAFDTYAQFYPNIMYAIESLKAGGGLLWNPFQSCGQPFFADIQVGLLYPLNWIFAFLPREAALLGLVMGNLTIAGIGMVCFCRTLGLNAAACLVGMITLQWSSGVLQLASWSPTHIGTYAWLPVALWRTEVLIRKPSLRSAMWLGGVLSIQLLPGFPQFSMFTYQLILLSVVWELLQPGQSRRLLILRLTGLALIIPVFMVAIQLLPSIELSANSIRHGAQSMADIGAGIAGGYFADHGWRDTRFPFATLWLGPFLLGFAALWDARTRRMAIWLLASSVLYFVLSLGPGSPVFDIYARLPAGSLFRDPIRFLFVQGFLMAGLAALGCQAILDSVSTNPEWRRTGAKILLFGALTAACMLTVPRLLKTSGLTAAIVIFLAILTAPFLRGRVMKPALALILLGSIGWHMAVVGRRPMQSLRAGNVYGRDDQVLEKVKARLSSQDRIFIEGRNLDFTLTPKTAQMQRIPSAYDYQPQSLARYADFFVFMTGMRRNDSFRTWLYLRKGGGLLQHSRVRHFRPRFLNWMAVRYLVVDQAIDKTSTVPASRRWKKIEDLESVGVYENLDAKPRARFIHKLIREDSKDPLLQIQSDSRLTPGNAVVADYPDGSPMEYPNSTKAKVNFLSDEPEYVSLQVESPAPGFVLLADSFYPGWQATVDGVSAPIYRANYAFRLVPIPAGSTTLEFRYRPKSVLVGAVVTIVSTILFVTVWIRSRASGESGSDLVLSEKSR